MYRQRLCMGVTPSVTATPEEQIRMIADAGFEAVFTGYDHGVPVEEYKKLTRECGLIYQSIHAPFHKDADVSKMWIPGDEGRAVSERLCRCVEVCSEVEVGIMVCHVYIGFKYDLPDDTTKAVGLENFGRIVRRAEELGVKVAFENTEGEEFLDVLMGGIDSKAMGFCWDTGHEQCYNRGLDMMALYGDKLVATHLNDNLGVKSFDGVTAPTDDLHLLPFDGINDWQSIARRLDDADFDGIMTFEVKPRAGRGHTSDIYAAMSPETYIAEAYKRACRVAALRKKHQHI